MPEQGSQFTCPDCGKPQFTADFGFEKHYHTGNGQVEEPCVFCGKSTSAYGLTKVNLNEDEDLKPQIKKAIEDFGNKVTMVNPRFFNRVPVDENGDETSEQDKVGYACQDCLANECTKCGKKILSGQLEVWDANDDAYHGECLKPSKHHECECGLHPDMNNKKPAKYGPLTCRCDGCK